MQTSVFFVKVSKWQFMDGTMVFLVLPVDLHQEWLVLLGLSLIELGLPGIETTLSILTVCQELPPLEVVFFLPKGNVAFGPLGDFQRSVRFLQEITLDLGIIIVEEPTEVLCHYIVNVEVQKILCDVSDFWSDGDIFGDERLEALILHGCDHVCCRIQIFVSPLNDYRLEIPRQGVLIRLEPCWVCKEHNVPRKTASGTN